MCVYRAALQNRIEHWVGDNEVRVRVRLDNLPLVVGEGRLKSQFETATSGGALNPPLRLQTEEALFAIPVTAPAAARPIYGYLAGSNEASVLQYGTVILRLHEDVRRRTTFTMADSLDHTRAGTVTCLAPALVTAPSCAALHTEYDLSNAPSAAHATGYGYVECQVHGGAATTDVGHVVFTRGIDPGPDLQEMLNTADLHWITVQGDEP